jgi:S-adenosyl methyltransferase
MPENDEWTPARIDVTTPSHARVYDYMLGGKDNFAVDRAVAERLLAVAPDSRRLARASRAFLVRAVRALAEAGIRQFLDLGTGIPTSPNVHEVARAVHPDTSVVYVDNDPVVLAHNRALQSIGEGVTTISGDIRRPEEILRQPELADLIDFSEPVGVLFVAVFHLVTDAEDPLGIIARFRERMVPGSHIVISQFATDSDPEAMAQIQQSYADGPTQLTFRTREQISGFFQGFEFLEPGVADVGSWRPDLEIPSTLLKVAGGVARKP